MSTTLEQVAVIEKALQRTVNQFHRYDASCAMPNAQWKAYRAWCREKYNMLREAHAAAINDCDQIIGKQWHFENTPPGKLPPEHGSG